MPSRRQHAHDAHPQAPAGAGPGGNRPRDLGRERMALHAAAACLWGSGCRSRCPSVWRAEGAMRRTVRPSPHEVRWMAAPSRGGFRPGVRGRPGPQVRVRWRAGNPLDHGSAERVRAERGRPARLLQDAGLVLDARRDRRACEEFQRLPRAARPLPARAALRRSFRLSHDGRQGRAACAEEGRHGDGVLGENRHYRRAEIKLAHFERTARDCRLPNAARVVDELLARVEPAIEAVSKELPARFPDSVSAPVFSGLERAARALGE